MDLNCPLMNILETSVLLMGQLESSSGLVGGWAGCGVIMVMMMVACLSCSPPSPPQHCGETILGSGWEKWYGDGEVITALAMSHLCLYCLFAF